MRAQREMGWRLATDRHADDETRCRTEDPRSTTLKISRILTGCRYKAIEAAEAPPLAPVGLPCHYNVHGLLYADNYREMLGNIRLGKCA
jgi:hypothetical protein